MQRKSAIFTTEGGPVSRWGFDEGSGSTAYDASSNSNDLTLTNMEAGDWQTGKSGSALSFDGTNEYLTRTYDTDFDFSTNNFTIGGWFKHDTISTNPDYLITRFTGAGWKVYLDSDGDLCFGIDDDATFTPDDSACSTNKNYDDNQWHHFEAVRTSTKLLLYIDSKLVASDTSLSATATLSGTSPVLYIGVDTGGSSNPWDGMIDDIKIYNYARNAGEIQQDYNDGLATHFR